MVPKKHRQIIVFSTPECGQSIVNTSKIDEFHVCVLTPFWVSFWRCFGSPNGGQSLQKCTSKKHQKMMATMSPKWSQRGPKREPKSSKMTSWISPSSTRAPKWPPWPLQHRFWSPFGSIWVPFWDDFWSENHTTESHSSDNSYNRNEEETTAQTTQTSE